MTPVNELGSLLPSTFPCWDFVNIIRTQSRSPQNDYLSSGFIRIPMYDKFPDSEDDFSKLKADPGGLAD